MGALLLSQYRHDMNDLLGDPTSMLTYPVFDSFQENRTIVGVLGMRIFWTLILRNLLPEHARGFVAVFENCGQTFSFQIDGSDATYLGIGDFHHPATEAWSVHGSLTAGTYHKPSPETRSYTRVELNRDLCGISVRLYPTAEFQQEFVNAQPMAQCAFVASMFFFAVLLFATYDFLVGRRQRIVLERALALSLIHI